MLNNDIAAVHAASIVQFTVRPDVDNETAIVRLTRLRALDQASSVTRYFNFGLVIGHGFHLLSFLGSTTPLAEVVAHLSYPLARPLKRRRISSVR
jgi:hypothetical protein